MAQIREAGDGAATPVLRIAGMTAGHNHLQLAAWDGRNRFTHCNYRRSKNERRSQTAGADQHISSRYSHLSPISFIEWYNSGC